MKKLILLALICASFTLQAQVRYQTVTMALDTPTNVAILRAGTQGLDLNAKFQSKLVSGTNIKSINGTSLLGSGNYIIPLPDTTLLRTVANSLSLAQIQTALNLKANDNAVVHIAGTETITGAKTFASDVQIPAIPVNATSAASVSYINNLITGITWKAATRVATTANITLSGTQTIDAIVLVAGDRVLVKNQTTQADNGIYIVSTSAWTRSLDADSGTEIETATVAVTAGTINRNTQWTCTVTAITIGTTPITFGQISGAGTYTNGSGLSLTGNVFAVTTAQPTITSVGTLTGLTLTGALSGTTANLTGAITAPLFNGMSVQNQISGFDLAGGSTSTFTQQIRGSGTLSGTNTGDQTTITGNSGTATTLQNPRTIWGQSFNGSANVSGALTGVTDLNASGTLTAINGVIGSGSAVNNSSIKVFDNGNIITKIQSQSSGDNAGIIGTESNHPFRLLSNNTIRATFSNTTGNFLINTTTDNGVDKLQVTGSASVSSQLKVGSATTSTTGYRLASRNQTTGALEQIDLGSVVGALITDGSNNISVAPAADRTTANTQNKSASYTVVLSDFGANGILYVRADATSGNMTITLPTALVMAGLEINVKKIDATANTVTISGSSIDGVTTKVLSGLNVFTSIVSNSTVFSIVGDKATGTGWASYSDGLYTLASPLSIATGTTVTLTNNAATSIKSQLPVGVTDFYNSATSKITPGSVGDGYGISVRFKAKSTSSSDFFDFGIDIGGTQGVIFKQTRTFIKGANTEVGFDISINAFSLATFIANGGLVKITAGNGTMSVYNVVYDIFRTHKAL